MSSINYVVPPINISAALGYNEPYLQIGFMPNTDLMLSLISVSYWMDNTVFSYDSTSDLTFELPCRVQIKYNGAPNTVISDLLLRMKCVRVYRAIDDKVYVNFTIILPNGIILPRATSAGVVVRLYTYGNTLLGILDLVNSSKTANCLFTTGGVGMMM